MTPELRLFRKVSGAWLRLLGVIFIAGWNFELLDRGGCGSFSLNLCAELDDRELPVIPALDDRLDVLFDGVYAYRGYVERTRPAVTEDGRPSFRVDGAGRMARASGILVDAQYSHPGGADVSDVYGWLAEKYLISSERLGDVVLAIAAVGYSVETISFADLDVRRAFDRLAEAAVDSLIWGFDTALPETTGADPVDRLYVQQRPSSVTTEAYRLRVGRDITFIEQPVDTGELINCVRFRGGPSKVPNLAWNGSFERPSNGGETISGSLLTNSSFQSATGWTLTGATIEESEGTLGAYARTGGQFLQLTSTDSARQTYDAGASIVDVPFVLSFYYAVKLPGDVDLDIDVVGLDSGGGSTGAIFSETVTTSSRSYVKYRRQFTPTAAGTERIRITISRSGGSDPGMVDDVWLFRNDLLVQDGWRQYDKGAGEGRIDWANEDRPFHGTYCVRAVTTGCDGTNANTVRLRTVSAHWISARRGTQYRIRVMMRTTSALEFRLGLARKDGGSVTFQWGSDTLTNATGQWTQYQITASTSGAEMISPIIELRGNGVFDLDALYVFESGILTNIYHYTPSENIEIYARASVRRSDLAVHESTNTKVKSAAVPFTSGDVGLLLRVTGGAGWTPADYDIEDFDGEYVTLSSSPAATSATGGAGDVIPTAEISDAAADSIETYGLRETVLDVPEIEDLDQALRYLTGYLNRYAVPLKRGSVVLEPCDVHLQDVAGDGAATPMGMVAVSGAKDAIESQFPVRISYSLTSAGQVRCELELTNRRPDLALLIKGALDASRSGGGGGSSSGAAGSGQAGPDDEEDVDGDYVHVAGDEMTGPLLIQPATVGDVPLQLLLPVGHGSLAAALQLMDPTGAHAFFSVLDEGRVTAQPVSAGSSIFTAYGYGTALNNGLFCRSARGVKGTELDIASGDVLGRMLVYGWGGGAYREAASFRAEAAEAFGSGASGSRWVWRLPSLGSITLVERMRLTALGLNIGDAADAHASAKVQISSTTQGDAGPRLTTDERNAISSPLSGLRCFDTTLDAHADFGVRWRWLSGVLFTQTADVVVASTASETSVIATGAGNFIGSMVLPANFWAVGKTIRYKVRGYIKNTGTPTMQAKVKLDAVTILDTGANAMLTHASNVRFELEGELVCRSIGASGTIMAQGHMRTQTAYREQIKTAAVTVDTTQQDTLDLTVQWGASDALNSVTVTNVTVEVLP